MDENKATFQVGDTVRSKTVDMNCWTGIVQRVIEQQRQRYIIYLYEVKWIDHNCTTIEESRKLWLINAPSESDSECNEDDDDDIVDEKDPSCRDISEEANDNEGEVVTVNVAPVQSPPIIATSEVSNPPKPKPTNKKGKKAAKSDEKPKEPPNPYMPNGILYVELENIKEDIETLPRSTASYKLKKPQWMKDKAINGVNEKFEYLLLLLPGFDMIVHATAEHWPVPVGMECKCSCDSESGIMLFLEIQEGKEAMREKMFQTAPFNLPSHTAMTLRLIKNWFKTNRIVVADSAFASLKTASEVLRNEMHFIGVVKTATSGFPKAVFDSWESTNPKRGEKLILQTKVDIDGTAHKVVAIDWKSKSFKRVISTCGNGEDSQHLHEVPRTRWKEVNGEVVTEHYMKQTIQCNIVETLFESFSAIDVHDHYRQGILGLERSWKTNSWWFRLLCTILGVTFTDSYFAYRHDFLSSLHNLASDLESFETFLSAVADSMIFNEFSGSTSEYFTRNKKRKHTESAEKVEYEFHTLKSLSEHPIYKEQKRSKQGHNYSTHSTIQRHCSICHKKASCFCETCSSGENIVTICSNLNNKHAQCYMKHLENISENNI